MPDSCTVIRQAHVAASPDEVFAHLVDLRRWRAWSPFEQLDPDMQRNRSCAEWSTTWSASTPARTATSGIVSSE